MDYLCLYYFFIFALNNLLLSILHNEQQLANKEIREDQSIFKFWFRLMHKRWKQGVGPPLFFGKDIHKMYKATKEMTYHRQSD